MFLRIENVIDERKRKYLRGYANKKYHSGLIWVGVFIGFAILKLSGSPKWYGNWKLMNMKINKII